MEPMYNEEPITPISPPASSDDGRILTSVNSPFDSSTNHEMIPSQSVEELAKATTIRQTSVFDEIKDNKWWKFFTNFLFYIRILVLLLTTLLLFLSTSYALAQLLEAKLDVITECPKPKTREEIWQHSYEATFKYPPDQILNEETMYAIFPVSFLNGFLCE